MPIYKTNKKNADGKNQYKVRINYTDANGNYKTINRNVYGSTEAKELERKLLEELNTTPDTADITIAELYKEYMATSKPEIRKTTYDKKASLYEHHIEPFLADKSLKDLTPKLLTEWKLYMESKGMRLVSKRNAFAQLKSMLSYAVTMEYIAKNPISKISNFKDSNEEENNISFYTPEEFLKYKASALEIAAETGNYDYYTFLCTLYYTGCRKGECHALRWSRIDGDIIHIKKSISQKTKGADTETLPKNKSSIRAVKAPMPLIEILAEQKERQKLHAKILGVEWSEDFFICGLLQPLRDSTIDKENRKIAKAAGLHHIRIHDFRHSHASLLINAGINVLEVSKRLGHSTIDQTLKTYAHLFPSEEARALSVLNNIK